MSDELVSGLLKDTDLRVVLVTTAELSRLARVTHKAEPAAAALFSQALSVAALMAALQKGEGSRINIQLECDGPLRGLFVDGDTTGLLRGYVKNPYVEYVGAEGTYRWRPVLGNKGFISVLRQGGDGDYYRSSVELQHFDFVKDLENYFNISDQVRTQLYLAQLPAAVDGTEEPLGKVAALLVQPLPDGDPEAFEAQRARLLGQFEGTVRVHGAAGAPALLKALFPQADLEVMSRYPLRYACGCSKDRVKRALLAMGREELADLLEKEGKAEATCQFCATQYVISAEEIREILATGSV
jgi:molecular chaperone Hsp33